MENKIVYSLYSNKNVAKKVASLFHAELGEVSIDHFADGEVLVKTVSDVKNKDVIIIESTAKKAHERIFELLLLVDSIKRGGPKSISLYLPYFGYSRQERVSWTNEPISCEVVAKILDTANVDKILTFDIHHPDIKEFFKTPFYTISTTPLFGDYYREYIKKNNLKGSDIIVVSPDHGSNSRADDLVKEIKGSKKVILSKTRPAPNYVEHLQVEQSEVKGKVCIIIDDIIDTGRTILSATELLFSQGAKAVLVGASHAVLSNNEFLESAKNHISDIVVTNTIEQSLPSDIHVLDISELIKI